MFRETDAEAIADFEQLRASGAVWFGVVKNISDDQGRNFMAHHANVIDQLNATARLVDGTDAYVIHKLVDQAPGAMIKWWQTPDCARSPRRPAAVR